MMLQALLNYAEREKLGDPDFEKVGVRWLIPLDSRGKLLAGPISSAEDPENKRPKPKQMYRPFTSQNELNQGDKSHFLCDTLERATLFLNEKSVEARRTQHNYFKHLLTEAADACPNDAPKIKAVLDFLDDPTALWRLHDYLRAEKAKVTDTASFLVDGISLLDLEEIKVFWHKQRSALINPKKKRVCLATGLLTETLDTHEKIKGVPGGLATGTNLISFDKDSFCSFGLVKAQNAALSASSELKIRSALNHLIEKSREQKLAFNNTIYLHWTRRPIQDDPIDLIASPNDNAVSELLKSFRSGYQPVGVDANDYYAMSLSGNGARIVVRDWLETTVFEVKQQVAEWFQDLGIVSPSGIGIEREFRFGALLYGMVRAELDELPPQIPTQLLHGALRGRSVALPQSLLAAALRRQQIEPTARDAKRIPTITARLALVKICLLRSPRAHDRIPQQKGDIVTECLNPESRDPAYLCGRLFAVFAEWQGAALQNVNAGLVERYYASTCTTPALTMGRLFRNAQFHHAKAESEGGWKKGRATNAQKECEAIICALGDQFPPALDLEGQGRFALGYYHQRAEFRRRIAERKEREANETDI